MAIHKSKLSYTITLPQTNLNIISHLLQIHYTYNYIKQFKVKQLQSNTRTYKLTKSVSRTQQYATHLLNQKLLSTKDLQNKLHQSERANGESAKSDNAVRDIWLQTIVYIKQKLTLKIQSPIYQSYVHRYRKLEPMKISFKNVPVIEVIEQMF
ncbi:Hypothetical_protein [Hexamita inflata]|uniref:Hypothetical_protein n=1 Tax=Hexamita inflata TaxID=28002 RepID=A0ABP1HSV7_9EUKA